MAFEMKLVGELFLAEIALCDHIDHTRIYLLLQLILGWTETLTQVLAH